MPPIFLGLRTNIFGVVQEYDEVLYTDKQDSRSKWKHKYSFNRGISEKVNTNVKDENFSIPGTDVDVNYHIEKTSSGVMILSSHSLEEIQQALSQADNR